MSASNGMARPPAAITAWQVSSTSACRRAETPTAAPARANAIAVARPMPDDAPLTKATLPSNTGTGDDRRTVPESPVLFGLGFHDLLRAAVDAFGRDIAIHQLDHRHAGRIAITHSRFQDARVAARPHLVAIGQRAEQL